MLMDGICRTGNGFYLSIFTKGKKFEINKINIHM